VIITIINNYASQSTFDKLIVNITSAQFFLAHSLLVVIRKLFVKSDRPRDLVVASVM